jgi:dipeptidyl aminopeptidase/acylaminoacyl peptidase
MQVAATPPAGPSQSRLLDPAIFGATCAVDWGPTAATADQIVYVDERRFVDAGEVQFFRVAESARSAGSPLLTVGRYPRITDIRWLPDGSGFLFARTNDLLDQAVNIHEYVFATKAERQITNFTGSFVRQFSVSPDGQQIAFERVTDLKGPSDLWVVRRDGTGARLLVRDARAPAWNPRLR